MIVHLYVTKHPSRFTTHAALFLQGRHWPSTVAKIDVTEAKHPLLCPGVAGQCTCM